MDALTDRTVWPLLTSLADCLCQQITDSGLPETCFCGIFPGEQVPFDYCDGCEDNLCGQAWVRLATMFPSAIFPTLDITAKCTSPLAIQLEIGIVRCAPMPTSDGTAPSLQDQLEASALQIADAMAMRRAIMCCAKVNSRRDNLLVGYTPVGPIGGCVGGVWTTMFSEA